MFRSVSRRLAATALGALVLLFPLAAAPPLTVIQDVLYKADGAKFTGVAVIEWPSFEASDSSNVSGGSLTVQIVDGILRVQLVPTMDSTPAALYTVKYNSNGATQFTETWRVPASATPVKLRAVRVTGSAPSGAPVVGGLLISDITGLTEELEARPVKGLEYTASRAAIIGATGLVEAAAGEASDCVRVDGSSGPCGAPATEPPPEFTDSETPAGTVDGLNRVFLLAASPSPASSLQLYRNGLLQKASLDYTLSNNTITFTTGSTPQSGDTLLASYRIAPSGSTTAAGVRVLCAGNGANTSSTTLTSLGQCAIPGGVLKTGDRIDVRFDVSHEGTGTGFAFDLRVGAAILVSRIGAASETAVAGRGEMGLRAAGSEWSSQSWGGTASLATAAGSAADNGAAGLTVDFLGRMTAPGNETVTLRQYTVLLYPAP